MIDTRLAPQAAVASPGAADAAAAVGESPPQTAGAEVIDFLALLAGSVQGALPGQPPPVQTPAAGPEEGELHTGPVADADGQEGAGQADLLALLAAVGLQVLAAPAATATAPAEGAEAAPAPAPAAPPSATPVPVAASAVAAEEAPAAGQDAPGRTVVTFRIDMPAQDAAATTGSEEGTGTPAAPAARQDDTLPGTAADGARSRSRAWQDAGAQGAGTPAELHRGTRAADAPAPRTAMPAEATPPLATSATQPAITAPAPAAGRVDHTPRTLAGEIEMRLRVAVRDQGRVVHLDLRPPELGRLEITVTRHDGVLQAQIIAERPEAARLLERALPHLAEMLQDRGLTLGSFDVAYQQGDPGSAGTAAGADGSSAGQDGPAAGTGTGAGGDDADAAGQATRDGSPVHDGSVDTLA